MLETVNLIMESKVKHATQRVKSDTNHLKDSIDKKNIRLVNKYLSQLRQSNDNLILLQIESETEENKESQFMLSATTAIEQADSMMFDANEFLCQLEETAENEALKLVQSQKFNDFKIAISSYLQKLEDTPEEVVEDLEGIAKISGIETNIIEKKAELKGFFETKIQLESQSVDKDFKEIGEMLQKAKKSLDSWVIQAESIRVTGERYYDNKDGLSNSRKDNERKPGLKLDRLALPVFKGNMRHFARFVRDFEKTVGREFSDPDLKLMYLQNQCLEGAPKEVVRNLTNFETAMERLKERYGKVSVVVDAVLKDIGEVRVGGAEEKAVIHLSRCLEKAWDDMEAINALDEFCNIMTVRTVESKLSSRLQLVWAEHKSEKNCKTSKETMMNLKNFIEKHRKIAEEVVAMGGKKVELSYDKPPRRDKIDNGRGSVNALSQNHDEKFKNKACFRCGWTNHQVKDCRVPSSIKCRRCGRTGHIENACDKPPVKQPPVGNCNFGTSTVRLPVELINTEFGSCLTLWDSGSMLNLVSRDWVQRAGIEGKRCNIEFKVVDGSVKTVETFIYHISLISSSGKTKVVKAYELETLATEVNKLNEKVLLKLLKSNNVPIELKDISNPQGNVQLLLGSELIADFPVVRHKIKELCFMHSEFGVNKFVVAGNHCLIKENSSVHLVCNASSIKITPLHDVCETVAAYVSGLKDPLHNFLAVEDLGVRPPPICRSCKSCQICKPAAQFLSLKDYRELNVIKSNLSYDKLDQCWVATYPFLKSPDVLKNNFESALCALKRREKRLMKDEQVRKGYQSQIDDFCRKRCYKKVDRAKLERLERSSLVY